MWSSRNLTLMLFGGMLWLQTGGCASTGMDKSKEAQAPRPLPKLNSPTHFSYGQLLERQGNYDGAAAQYRLAVEMRPNFVVAENRLGVVLNKLGRHGEASEVFRRAVTRHPEVAYLHNNLGFSQLLDGDYAGAEAETRKAIEIRPTFARARMNHALALAKQGFFEAAFMEFSRVGNGVDAHYNLAVVQADAGHYDQAMISLGKALELNPGLEPARREMDRLSRLYQKPAIQPAATETAPATPLATDIPTPAHPTVELAAAEERALFVPGAAAEANDTEPVEASGMTELEVAEEIGEIEASNIEDEVLGGNRVDAMNLPIETTDTPELDVAIEHGVDDAPTPSGIGAASGPKTPNTDTWIAGDGERVEVVDAPEAHDSPALPYQDVFAEPWGLDGFAPTSTERVWGDSATLDEPLLLADAGVLTPFVPAADANSSQFVIEAPAIVIPPIDPAMFATKAADAQPAAESVVAELNNPVTEASFIEIVPVTTEPLDSDCEESSDAVNHAAGTRLHDITRALAACRFGTFQLAEFLMTLPHSLDCPAVEHADSQTVPQEKPVHAELY